MFARDRWRVCSSSAERDMRMFKDDSWSRQPSNAWNPVRGAKVHKLVERDCQMTLKLMTDQIHINQDMTILQILHEDLAKTKICAKFVPYSVRDRQQEHRVKIYEIHILSDASILGMSLGCFSTILKYHSNREQTQSSVGPRKICLQKSRIKRMFSTCKINCMWFVKNLSLKKKDWTIKFCVNIIITTGSTAPGGPWPLKKLCQFVSVEGDFLLILDP
jgi:hypothetical protein